MHYSFVHWFLAPTYVSAHLISSSGGAVDSSQSSIHPNVFHSLSQQISQQISQQKNGYKPFVLYETNYINKRNDTLYYEVR